MNMLTLITHLLSYLNIAFAAPPHSQCGKFLGSDPHYKNLDGRTLDDPTLQDLLTLRFERFSSPILLVGEGGEGNTVLVDAILEKAAALDIAYVRFRRRSLVSNIPDLSDSLGLKFFNEQGASPENVRAWIPAGSLLVIDYDLSDYFTRATGEPASERLFDLDPFRNSLKLLQGATQLNSAFGIHTIPIEAFTAIAHYNGSELARHFKIVHAGGSNASSFTLQTLLREGR